MMLDGNFSGFLIFINVVPLIFRLRAANAILLSVLLIFIQTTRFIGSGTKPDVFIYLVLFQLQVATGCSTSYYCWIGHFNSKYEFASNQNAKLLHTLIPPDVASRC